MKTFVYSFEDTVMTISHPHFGSYSAYGSGIGQLSVSFANEVTNHEVAADLSVIVSKFAPKNGTIGMEIVQSSDFNKWLKRWAKYLETSSAEEFALTTITISNKSTGSSYTATGCSHQKKPDEGYGPTASNITWTIMAANIDAN